jgi:hypothetical protein
MLPGNCGNRVSMHVISHFPFQKARSSRCNRMHTDPSVLFVAAKLFASCSQDIALPATATIL